MSTENAKNIGSSEIGGLTIRTVFRFLVDMLVPLFAVSASPRAEDVRDKEFVKYNCFVGSNRIDDAAKWIIKNRKYYRNGRSVMATMQDWWEAIDQTHE